MTAILSKHLLFLFLLAAGFLTFSALVCHHAVGVMQQNQHQVTHTLKVLARLQGIRATLAQAEGNQRNFLLTGTEDYLPEYQETAEGLTSDLGELIRMTADNPPQQTRASALKQSVAQRLISLDHGMTELHAGGIDAARAWILHGTGRQEMERATTLLTSMDAEENRLLAARSAQSAASLRSVIVTFSLLALMSAGLLVVIFFTVRREVATRIESGRQVRESEGRLMMAVEASRLGIWEHDLVTGRIVSSERCEAMFGLPIGEPVTAEAIWARLHPDDRERLDAVIRRSTEPSGRGEYMIEYRVVWPGDSPDTERWVRARGRAIFEGTGANRRAVRLIGTLQDVTETRQAEATLRNAMEQAQAANRAKDQFLAVLSHELRTPLTPVLAAVSDIEQRVDLPAALRDEVAVVRRNVELEARLIDDLLDLTRVARGKIRLHAEVVNLHQLIPGIIAMFRDTAAEKKLELTIDQSASEYHVWGDPGRLQQVLWNLISNALKFTPSGGHIRLRTSNDLDGRLRIEIADNGIGIEADALPRLFNAFEQGEQTIARKYGGLGLGLSIAKAIVDLHGGQLEARSDGKNQGTTFVLTLKTVEAPKPFAAHAPAPSPSDAQAQRRLRILLVEDNEDTRRLMGRLLRLFGHDVSAADCVAAALDLAKSETFDLLVSDIGLPDGTGWDLMAQLADRRPPKAIALSGFGMEDDLRRSRDAGFLEHVTKPVNITVLREMITRMI